MKYYYLVDNINSCWHFNVSIWYLRLLLIPKTKTERRKPQFAVSNSGPIQAANPDRQFHPFIVSHIYSFLNAIENYMSFECYSGTVYWMVRCAALATYQPKMIYYGYLTCYILNLLSVLLFFHFSLRSHIFSVRVCPPLLSTNPFFPSLFSALLEDCECAWTGRWWDELSISGHESIDFNLSQRYTSTCTHEYTFVFKGSLGKSGSLCLCTSWAQWCFWYVQVMP